MKNFSKPKRYYLPTVDPIMQDLIDMLGICIIRDSQIIPHRYRLIVDNRTAFVIDRPPYNKVQYDLSVIHHHLYPRNLPPPNLTDTIEQIIYQKIQPETIRIRQR